jgi:hypothetical protein
MSAKIPSLILVALMLTACGGGEGPGPEIHDTKYLAIGPDGQALEPVSDEARGEGDCVLDQFIGLTWEVKTDSPGLRDWRNTYSWYAPGESNDGELDYRGTKNGGNCVGSECDTSAYVEAVNQSVYCGHNDWRMPTRDELGSISDPRKLDQPPTINLKFFPHTQPDEYWSGNDYQFQYNAAWLWNYQFGHDRVEWKASARRVRLVRGEAVQLERTKE